MCSTCGCSDHTNIHVHELNQPDAAPVEHSHASLNAHDHSNAGHHHVHTETDHRHSHQVVAADSRSAKIVQLERDILAKNSLIAQRNRGWLEGREVLALNLMSSPGAGKTTLLERTIRELDGAPPVLVVEGDQATARDAVRIRRAGGRAIQINTGSGCHLDAAMLSAALATLNPPQHSLLLIENVGNLVCPALFDLGEAARVVLMSATEGEDKPLKYPNIFRFADVMILNKTDLLPHLSFDVDECIRYARQVNPKLAIFGLSALSRRRSRKLVCMAAHKFRSAASLTDTVTALCFELCRHSFDVSRVTDDSKFPLTTSSRSACFLSRVDLLLLAV